TLTKIAAQKSGRLSFYCVPAIADGSTKKEKNRRRKEWIKRKEEKRREDKKKRNKKSPRDVDRK
ncbi:MAG: hypothetical protein K2L39_03200, partial [Muribaculaceae bacterium]|nr:hypothetical protein [Muribaculaceae bacterium]